MIHKRQDHKQIKTRFIHEKAVAKAHILRIFMAYKGIG